MGNKRKACATIKISKKKKRGCTGWRDTVRR
jgi:hypothetical protein